MLRLAVIGRLVSLLALSLVLLVLLLLLLLLLVVSLLLVSVVVVRPIVLIVIVVDETWHVIVVVVTVVMEYSRWKIFRTDTRRVFTINKECPNGINSSVSRPQKSDISIVNLRTNVLLYQL